jgi:hypothetical protein
MKALASFPLEKVKFECPVKSGKKSIQFIITHFHSDETKKDVFPLFSGLCMAKK